MKDKNKGTFLNIMTRLKNLHIFCGQKQTQKEPFIINCLYL
jgi:hypothetical protein